MSAYGRCLLAGDVWTLVVVQLYCDLTLPAIVSMPTTQYWQKNCNSVSLARLALQLHLLQQVLQSTWVLWATFVPQATQYRKYHWLPQPHRLPHIMWCHRLTRKYLHCSTGHTSTADYPSIGYHSVVVCHRLPQHHRLPHKKAWIMRCQSLKKGNPGGLVGLGLTPSNASWAWWAEKEDNKSGSLQSAHILLVHSARYLTIKYGYNSF